MTFDIENIVRKNIKDLAPYTTARHEFTGEAEIFLDANENAFGSPIPLSIGEGSGVRYNRYPDPQQINVKEKLSAIKGIPTQNIFLGNGSDEAIDVLFRIVCEPSKDNIIINTPTYGMYKVCADINNVVVREVPLNKFFQLDMDGIKMAIDNNTKIIFICSPNNPTGNSIVKNDIEKILKEFNGIVVIDEAYINYSTQPSLVKALLDYPNLVILQTLSKAWGLAGLRLGMAYASQAIINYMNKVKYPYNINEATQVLALQALQNVEQVNTWTKETIAQRDAVAHFLLTNNLCEIVHQSDANFLLVQFNDAHTLYNYLCQKGIIVRDRSNVSLIKSCLRITIGTANENKTLLTEILSFYKK
jgi:histidinol-phosphate aminotransferase